MKKIILILICIVILTGCTRNDINSDNTIDDNEISNLTDYIRIKGADKIVCSALTNASISYDNNFVEKNSKDIYYINFEQLYSNNENCKIGYQASNPIVGSKNAGGNSGFRDNKGNSYISEYGAEYIDKMVKTKVVSVLKDDEIMTYMSSDTFIYSIYSLKDKTLNIIMEQYNSTDKIYKVDLSIINDEKVISIYENVIKTDKNFYMMEKVYTNKDECEKYDDVACEYNYALRKSQILSNSYNDILNIINGKIITINYEVVELYEIEKLELNK